MGRVRHDGVLLLLCSDTGTGRVRDLFRHDELRCCLSLTDTSREIFDEWKYGIISLSAYFSKRVSMFTFWVLVTLQVTYSK